MSLLQGCTVLVVEDEYFLAQDIADALTAHGAAIVGPIADLDDVLDQVNRDGFDVAVLDIGLHDRSAYVVADHLDRAAIPYMFTTGYSAEVIPHRFGHILRMEKPYDSNRLVQHVAQLCSAKADSPITSKYQC